MPVPRRALRRVLLPAAAAALTAFPAPALAAAPSPSAPAGCTATATAVTCHLDVPPGNYEVHALLGSRRDAAATSALAEARRRVLGVVRTAPGRLVPRTFAVNVRTPESMPTGEEGPGTPGLDLTFDGPAPALAGLRVTPAAHRPVLYLIGDSTVCDWLNGPKRGWGQELQPFLRPGVPLANYGDSGESSVSYLANPALFRTVQALIRPGDTVAIQLAHNDKTTPAATYTRDLTTMIDGVRRRGGTPVLVTPPVRHLFGADGRLTPTGLIVNNLGVDLPAAMRQVAADRHVGLVDLTAMSAHLVESLGEQASWRLYLTQDADGVTDSSHFSTYGATRMAGLVARGLRRLPPR